MPKKKIEQQPKEVLEVDQSEIPGFNPFQQQPGQQPDQVPPIQPAQPVQPEASICKAIEQPQVQQPQAQQPQPVQQPETVAPEIAQQQEAQPKGIMQIRAVELVEVNGVCLLEYVVRTNRTLGNIGEEIPLG